MSFFFSYTNLSWYCETIGNILKYILGNIPRFLWERYSKTIGKYSRSNFTGRRISLTILITFYTIIWSLESVGKHKFQVIIFNLTTLWTQTFNKQNTIQTSHPDYTQEHKTPTNHIYRCYNKYFKLSLFGYCNKTKQDTDTHWWYILQHDVLFHRQSSMNVRYN